MHINRRLKKYKERYPKTVKYIRKTFKKNLRCGACGGSILRETNMRGYPYQCMNCDEDKYEFEVKHVKSDITDKELNDLVERTAELLLLDD